MRAVTTLQFGRSERNTLGDILEARGARLPDRSPLHQIVIQRRDGNYYFRINDHDPLTVMVDRGNGNVQSFSADSQNVGINNFLGPVGGSATLLIAGEAYPLMLQELPAAPSRTLRDWVAGLPGIGRFFRPTPPPAPRAAPTPSPVQVVVPASQTGAPRPEAQRVVEMPVCRPLPPATGEHLSPGETRLVVDTNPGRSGEHDVYFDAFGQASAFTELGIDKSNTNTNEDAYGMGRSPDGRPFFIMVDGAGGHGGGDIASQIIVEQSSRILSQENGVSLAEALQRANSILLTHNQAHHSNNSAVAVLARVNRDGSIEYARIGDANIWLRLRQPDGSYAVTMPFLPANLAGYARQDTLNSGGRFNTLQMIAHSQVSVVTSILGQHEVAPSSNPFQGIHYQAQLQIPGTNTPLRLEAGDGFALICDGVAEQTNMQQATMSLANEEGAIALRQRNQAETQLRQAIYTHYVPIARQQRGRVEINMDPRPENRNHPLNHTWIDGNGNIYSSADSSDTTIIGHVAKDNISAIWFHYDPSLRAVNPQTPQGT